MEIKIDEEMIQTTLDQESGKAIQEAFRGWKMQEAMTNAVVSSIIPEIMSNAIQDAASKIDIANLTQKLAEEMSRSITGGIQHIVQDAMAEIIMDISKVPRYDDKKRAEAKAKIFADLNNGRKP